MRTLVFTGNFKRDLKRQRKGKYMPALESDLADVLNLLAEDAPLPQKYHDHPLKGTSEPIRDCHIYPDLVLLYQKPEGELRLIRLGSHSEVFG